MESCMEPVIHAKVFANEFHKLCKNFTAPHKDSNKLINLRVAKCNERIIDFLVRIKSCMDRGRCDAPTFMNEVMKINSFKLLEIEIWWYLLRCDIMNQEDFFRIFGSNDFGQITDYFCQCLCRNILRESSDSSFRKSMNSDFIAMLLQHKDRCYLQDIRSTAYINFLKFISSQNITENQQEILNIDSLVETSMNSVKDSVSKSFLLDLIEALLQGESMTLEAILNINEHYIKKEKVIVKKNFKMFQLLDVKDIISHLKRIFLESAHPIHWKNLFYIISLITKHNEENLKHFKPLISELLEDALQNLNKTSLLYVFILSRQCSSRQMPHFPSYVNWFSSTFSVESSRPINTKEKAIFLMDFLTETVQFDSCYYLKVHINRIPCLPPDCQFLRSDYVKLVKTKLMDMNETTELGLFDNITTKTSAEFDVETVLDIYSSTNEVPKCVLEASLFSKSYYEKQFLITLLTHCEGKNSVRHKFITKLQSLGKIPEHLFVNYKLHMIN